MKSSSFFTAAATVSAMAVMATSGAMLAKSFSPKELRDYIQGLILKAFKPFSTNMTMVINEISQVSNELFQDAQLYKSTRITPLNSTEVMLFVHENGPVTFALLKDGTFTDTFSGVKLSWTLRSCEIINVSNNVQVLYYEITFPKKAADMVKGYYLPFVSCEAASMRGIVAGR